MTHRLESAEHHGHHIIPKKTLLRIFIALIGLTILTVLAAQVHTGPLHVPIALAIAITKAALVVMFFMGLKYDSPMNTLVFSVGVIWVVVFLTFTLFDTVFRGDLANAQADPITDIQRQERAMMAREPKQSTPAAAVSPDSTAPVVADTMAATAADSAKAAPGQAQ